MYLAINKATGEEIEGTAQKIGDRLGVSYKTVYRASSQATLIHSVWEVQGLDKDTITCISQSFPEDWDKTRKEIRELLKKYPRTEVVRVKRKSHFRKPQEI